MKTTIDEGFIGRVYKTSAFLWGFGLLICLSFLMFQTAIGWSIGCAMSVGTLRSLEWIIRKDFVPGAASAKRALMKFSLMKLPAVLAILCLVVWLGGRHIALLIGFCAGLILTQAVIVLKALGMLFSERLSSN